jgi:hypothetical protein
LKRGAAPKGPRQRGFVKLEPHLPTVDRLLGEGVWNAEDILKLLQVDGYTGGASQLKRYIHPRP